MHIYEKNNQLYPSVTTIVGYFKDKPSFESLQKWANFLGFNRISYSKELDRKAKFGSLVHALIASELASIPIDSKLYEGMSDVDINKATEALKRFNEFRCDNLINPSDTIFSEKTFVSEKLGYAGTLDWLGSYKNKLFLIDFKTSFKVHDSMKLQLSAYRELLKEEADIDIDNAAILLINESSVKEFDITLEELDECYKKFSVMFELYKLYNPYDDIDPSDVIKI